MAKRGRPRTYGEKPGWMFVRLGFVLCAFDEAKKNGEKYVDAISAGISAVRSRFPEMRISRTEVKRMLAARQLENPDQTLLFWEDPPECSNLASATDAGLPATSVTRPRRLAFGFGPRPAHPRNNARTDK